MPVSTSNAPGEPNKYSILGQGNISVVSNAGVQAISSLVVPAIGDGYLKVTIEYNQTGAAGTCQTYVGTTNAGTELSASQAAATFIRSIFIIRKNTATPANIDGSTESYGAASCAVSSYVNGAGVFNLSATEELFINVKCFVAGGTITGKWLIEYIKA